MIKSILAIDSSAISQEKFNEIYFNNTKPIQLCGLDLSMPLYHKWTFDFFKKFGSNFLCQVGDNLQDPATITRKLSISEYINTIQQGDVCPYMIGWSYQKDCPELDEDFSLPNVQPQDFITMLPKHLQFRRRWIFFGKKGLESDLHIDCFCTSAWILMARGSKTFRGISPLHQQDIAMGSSLFDPMVVEQLSQKKIEIHEFKLTPGTILYIPTGWIHQIRNEDDNIMVTGGFTADKHVFRFFNNFHEFILRDSRESEEIYHHYLKNILEPQSLSPQIIDAIINDLAFTQQRINELNEKITTYETLLANARRAKVCMN